MTPTLQISKLGASRFLSSRPHNTLISRSFISKDLHGNIQASLPGSEKIISFLWLVFHTFLSPLETKASLIHVWGNFHDIISTGVTDQWCFSSHHIHTLLLLNQSQSIPMIPALCKKWQQYMVEVCHNIKWCSVFVFYYLHWWKIIFLLLQDRIVIYNSQIMWPTEY